MARKDKFTISDSLELTKDEGNSIKKAIDGVSIHEMDTIIKGGKALPIGTKRTHGGVEVEKTAQGWKPTKKGSKEGSSKDPNERFKMNQSDKFSPDATHTKKQVMDHMIQLNAEKQKLGKLTPKTREYNRQMHKVNRMGDMVISDKNGSAIDLRSKDAAEKVLNHVKEIIKLKEKRNKIRVPSLAKRNLQAKIDKMEARIITDPKTGRTVDLKPEPENPMLKEPAGKKSGNGVINSSTDVNYITNRYSYMKDRLKNVTGKVDIVVVKRDTSGMRGSQDPWMMEIHQNGKKLADLGTHPNPNGTNRSTGKPFRIADGFEKYGKTPR